LSNTKILVTALLTYLAVCIAGGAGYYYYSMMAPPSPPLEEKAEKPPKEKPPEPKATAEEAAMKAAAAEREAEAVKAKAAEKQKARQNAAVRERDMARLEAGMQKNKNGSVTIYSYPRADRLPSGLYLNPSLVVGRKCRLQYELYYYYNINDGNGSAWIFGDRLVIKARGRHYEFALDPEKRQKALAPDAEWLSERYTGLANEAWIEALRAVAAAGYGTMTYYQQGGQSITAEFSGDAFWHVKNMVDLYDLNVEQGKAEAED
jgi:hypothetical protein